MKKLRRSNLSGDAYTFVRKLVLDGDGFRPGEKISVEKLSRDLGVSRTPLWGAINRLQAEGILDVVPRLGVYVVKYDRKRALEIYLIREALEGVAARSLSATITEAQISRLEENIKAQKQFLKSNRMSLYFNASLGFHELIASMTGNGALEKILESVYAQVRAMRIQQKFVPTHLPRSCDDHDELLNAFRKRNANLAEKLARSHIRDLADDIEQHDGDIDAIASDGRKKASQLR